MDQALASGLSRGTDGQVRCIWQMDLPDYRHYHDVEWGRPVWDDTRLFEKLCLEGFQSGLSWLTILRKREGFRAAFAGFDIDRVAEFGEDDIARCLADAGIVRHRGKIVSTINNARRAQALRAEFGSLARYLWQFEPKEAERPASVTYEALIANPKTEASIRLSKDLKKRGWTFVGPTTVYAFMQAMGMVNDHVEGCCCRAEVETERAAFLRP
ncbi:3-methyladenine DNA glycosylase [Xaviernesmea oryzae]|uniref:3-methyladenine DNA glycosylase n=1 Tax=Xaviernesmea oryzae TaxID=464029 RepID=A0A1Q9ARI9_9HYPH|nr:DNA-3-methyladenine glycosylase I [Xaviernesmea oryzae]OLP58052.1 3-methyladenine DNA glycosylase [Xaviernesmea oryzae]SEL84287.1 DNA-3-methyladenine glycosylase I [Xaviernesmea oryzae]